MRIAFQKAKWARAVALGLVLFAACGARDKTPATQAEGNDSPQVVFEGPRVLFLGDSLSAGLHLPANEAFPAVLAQLLAAEGHPIELVNAGVSGDTTAGGLARLDWLLRQDPDLFVLELGANDGLRGVSLESIESNLRAIVRRVQDRWIPLLLLGLRLPPNYGQTYTTGFADLFARIAADTEVTYVPFFLESVAAHPAFNLPDGLHPNTEGHQRIGEDLLPVLRELVEQAEQAKR